MRPTSDSPSPPVPPQPRPGPVVLFGSGETAAVAGRVYDRLAPLLPSTPRLAVIETPAGFQPNSAAVAGKVADYLAGRLQALRPSVDIVPARRRGTPTSPDEPAVVDRLANADLLFLGPGSPTYAARQLAGSRAWQLLQARHQAGAAVVLASAATIAAGTRVLPVYEIYKAGSDLHWTAGLDLLGRYGLPLVLVPHWNNSEGGAGLDTSRCFMGVERFAALRALLPSATTIVGIDEHTALVLDLAAGSGQVLGRGGVTVLRVADEWRFAAGEQLSVDQLGTLQRPGPGAGLEPAIWALAQPKTNGAAPTEGPPAAVQALAAERQQARERGDWGRADQLRHELAAAGWLVRDTRGGPELRPADEA